jgi:hypothetical protein
MHDAPLVTLWPPPGEVHRTVSPAEMLSSSGVKRETRSDGQIENLAGRRWHPIEHGPAILINNSDDCCVALFQCRGNCDRACVRGDWGCAKQCQANESVQLAERGSRSGFLFHPSSWLKKDVVTRSPLKMSRYFLASASPPIDFTQGEIGQAFRGF